MKSPKLLAFAALGVTLAAVAAKDPVLMKVAGIEVPLSEFEYLYNKNSRQQMQAQPLAEYLEVFKNYKRKVADAIAAGKDTTAQFRREFNQYRHELALPFTTDSTYIESLAEEEYSRMHTEAQASHIMRFKANNPDDNRTSIRLLDSVKNLIDNGASFAEMAKLYSQDRGSMNSGGVIGYIPAGRFPYAFEKTVFETPEGTVTGIIETPMGYHLIKGGKKRPARGSVLVAHILKIVPQESQMSGGLTLNSDEEVRAKATIDSIYGILLNDPTTFESLALRYSDDKGSGRAGGKLPWFGSAEMVQEFDSVAFAVTPGEISAPFRTQYGWHIIKGIDRAPVKTYPEMRRQIIDIVTNKRDIRAQMIADRQFDNLHKEFKGKYNKNYLSAAKAYIAKEGLDSVFAEKFLGNDMASTPVYTFDKQTVTVADIAPALKNITLRDTEFATTEFDKQTRFVIGKALAAHKEEKLAITEPEYSNLVKEFHDGSLLYEIGKDRVWDRSSQDTEGLNNYFQTHRDDYKWKEPKAKGLLIQTTSDSVSNVIESQIAGLDNDSIVNLIRKDHFKEAKVERILAPKGSNPLVDFAVFGGEEAKPANSKYTDFFFYNFKILDAPEEVNDVRGLVTGDYQMFLEKEWEEELKAKYPVTVDEKILKKVKLKSEK